MSKEIYVDKIYLKDSNIETPSSPDIFQEKMTIFKDKFNSKPPGGEGFYAHYDGIFLWKNKKNFEKKLYTRNIPDPEILIRTGGAKRLSNFLLWQLAYAEIFFVDKLWPDFNENDFNRIISTFYKIKRNFGKI